MELALEHELLEAKDSNTTEGAHFWVSISSKNETAEKLKDWKVVFCHLKTGWIGEINSDNPNQNLFTPGLSGLFSVEAFVTGPHDEWQKIEAEEGTNPMIGCKKHCASMVEISRKSSSSAFQYSTKWNVLCQEIDVVSDLSFDF